MLAVQTQTSQPLILSRSNTVAVDGQWHHSHSHSHSTAALTAVTGRAITDTPPLWSSALVIFQTRGRNIADRSVGSSASSTDPAST